MLYTKDLSEKMKKCLRYVDVFTLEELRKKLNNYGCVYNVDYDGIVLSNAILSLVRQGFIAAKEGERATYVVCGVNDREDELKYMRDKIKELLEASRIEIEQILDAEKPSELGKNKKTYDDIVRLLDYMREFKFRVEE